MDTHQPPSSSPHLFLITLGRALPALLALASTTSARAFDYFEHRWIGDVTCGLFAEDPADCVLWSDAPGGVGTITFGDLTALVGNHYGTGAELTAALSAISRRPSDRSACIGEGDAAADKLCAVLAYRELELAYVRGWLGDRGAVGDLEACAPLTPWLGSIAAERTQRSREQCRTELTDTAHAAGEAVPLRTAGDCFSPDGHLVNRLRALPDRIALAAGGDSHFGGPALANWDRYHRQARRLDAKGDAIPALVAEAFALHFLTDLHAAGHMRNPHDSPGHDLADAMRYHDQDNEAGLLVEPHQGPTRRWYAYGDRCLFGDPARTNRAMVVLAAVSSFEDMSRPGLASYRFLPPKLSALDMTPLPTKDSTAPLVLSLYTGAGGLASSDGTSGGMELVLAHDWQLTTWWNPFPDLRHGVSFWADGTVVIEVASAPLVELLTLPAVPFVALSSVAAAEALRRIGKGIDPWARLSLGLVNIQLDADAGLALVRRKPDETFRANLLVRAGVFLEVPDRWRFYVPRITALIGDDQDRLRLLTTFTFGLEHSL